MKAEKAGESGETIFKLFRAVLQEAHLARCRVENKQTAHQTNAFWLQVMAHSVYRSRCDSAVIPEEETRSEGSDEHSGESGGSSEEERTVKGDEVRWQSNHLADILQKTVPWRAQSSFIDNCVRQMHKIQYNLLCSRPPPRTIRPIQTAVEGSPTNCPTRSCRLLQEL